MGPARPSREIPNTFLHDRLEVSSCNTLPFRNIGYLTQQWTQLAKFVAPWLSSAFYKIDDVHKCPLQDLTIMAGRATLNLLSEFPHLEHLVVTFKDDDATALQTMEYGNNMILVLLVYKYIIFSLYCICCFRPYIFQHWRTKLCCLSSPS
jgi:hypothetical protein